MISLHEDSYKNESAHGAATYFYGSEAHGVHSIVGERFASLVQREICARTDFANCRTHAMTWELLRLTKAPAVRLIWVIKLIQAILAVCLVLIFVM